MRLGTRLTLYFVSAIAVILAGFSIALYTLAVKHLHRQADERLEAALNTLTAAAEIEADDVTWEPLERNLTFGRRTLEGQFSWRISDENGRRIDGTAIGELDHALSTLDGDGSTHRPFVTYTDASGIPWRLLSRRLEGQRRSELHEPVLRPPGHYKALIIAAGGSLEGVRTNLRNLGLALGALSLAVWSLTLIAGRKLCDLALRPVAEMAAAAHEIGGDDSEGRLPPPKTDDELAELGRSFNALLDRLGESMQRQRRFTGDASHQLRTPLTSLQGHVDLALRQERSPEEYRRALTLVQSKTRNLRQIVDGLMFLSRADAESRHPILEEIELEPWLRDHLDSWAGIRRSDLVFESEASGLCRVLVHPPLLGELMNNLIDNAAKYGPTDTPIRVHLASDETEVLISVSDEGPGIDRADVPHIFEPFFRAEAARIRGTTGIGLGLSIAARIASAFGARIEVNNAPGTGATFTVTFPLGDFCESATVTKKENGGKADHAD